MEKFNSRLTVGGKAIIIGTRLPENNWMIGKVVTVEAIYKQGEEVDKFRFIDKSIHNENYLNRSNNIIAIVSGIDYNKVIFWISNHTCFDDFNLMPIDDDEMNKMFELEENPYLEKVKQ